MQETHTAGQLVRQNVTFTNTETNELVDPSVITLEVQDPAGNKTTYTYGVSTIERESEGRYYALIDTTSGFDASPPEGIWYWVWKSTGTGQAILGGSFVVTAPVIT